LTNGISLRDREQMERKNLSVLREHRFELKIPCEQLTYMQMSSFPWSYSLSFQKTGSLRSMVLKTRSNVCTVISKFVKH